jgi:hypothetical protein
MNPFDDQLINQGLQIAEDTPLYRVFTKDRLLQMFKDRKLTLVAPDLWDDPFENFLAKCPVSVGGMTGVRIDGLFKNFYGQCWTLNPESDAMWRIYSPNKDGARVSTTAGRLFRAIYDPHNPSASMSFYIGSVGYESEGVLRRHFEDPANASGAALDSTGRGQAMTLFLKREEFKHEAEVRLLYRFNKDGCSDQRPEKIWQFTIDPNDLFQDVLFDPRMDIADFTKESKELQTLGCSRPIGKSTLYQLPNLKITIRSSF